MLFRSASRHWPRLGPRENFPLTLRHEREAGIITGFVKNFENFLFRYHTSKAHASRRPMPPRASRARLLAYPLHAAVLQLVHGIAQNADVLATVACEHDGTPLLFQLQEQLAHVGKPLLVEAVHRLV